MTVITRTGRAIDPELRPCVLHWLHRVDMIVLDAAVVVA
jgi:hypothetical protein